MQERNHKRSLNFGDACNFLAFRSLICFGNQTSIGALWLFQLSGIFNTMQSCVLYICSCERLLWLQQSRMFLSLNPSRLTGIKHIYRSSSLIYSRQFPQKSHLSRAVSVVTQQIVSQGELWLMRDEEEEGSDKSVALNCYWFIPLSFFLAAEGYELGRSCCGGLKEAAIVSPVFRASCCFPSNVQFFEGVGEWSTLTSFIISTVTIFISFHFGLLSLSNERFKIHAPCLEVNSVNSSIQLSPRNFRNKSEFEREMVKHL